jgi:hypothetical protein
MNTRKSRNGPSLPRRRAEGLAANPESIARGGRQAVVDPDRA